MTINALFLQMTLNQEKMMKLNKKRKRLSMNLFLFYLIYRGVFPSEGAPNASPQIFPHGPRQPSFLEEVGKNESFCLFFTLRFGIRVIDYTLY